LYNSDIYIQARYPDTQNFLAFTYHAIPSMLSTGKPALTDFILSIPEFISMLFKKTVNSS
jgi:hypothetical protein